MLSIALKKVKIFMEVLSVGTTLLITMLTAVIVTGVAGPSSRQGLPGSSALNQNPIVV
jgi:hypothetical protein